MCSMVPGLHLFWAAYNASVRWPNHGNNQSEPLSKRKAKCLSFLGLMVFLSLPPGLCVRARLERDLPYTFKVSLQAIFPTEGRRGCALHQHLLQVFSQEVETSAVASTPNGAIFNFYTRTSPAYGTRAVVRLARLWLC